MKYIRAKANFYRLSDEKLAVLAAHIIACIKNSVIFTQPTPTIEELEDAYKSYTHYLICPNKRTRETKALKRESKRLLADLFQQLVYYVNTVANGELPLLYSSGFPVLSQKRTGVTPDIPKEIRLEDGHRSGELSFRFTPVGRDMQYEYQFSESDANAVQLSWSESKFTSKSFRTYQDGFKMGQVIYFRIRARNKNGTSDWSTPIRFIVR